MVAIVNASVSQHKNTFSLNLCFFLVSASFVLQNCQFHKTSDLMPSETAGLLCTLIGVFNRHSVSE